jgi:cytochrome c oxidase cbb3-type subunit 2
MTERTDEGRIEVGEDAKDRKLAPIMKATAGMSRAVPLAGGIVAVVLASYMGLVVVPNWQVEPLEPVLLDNGDIYPKELSVEAQQGREVYVDLGCVYCHSQQVRTDDFGGDISRGYGARASLPIDYVHAERPLFGTMRTGPDLRNIGVRQPSRTWHYLHLYNPRITSDYSTMPPFPFLFRHIDADKTLAPPEGALDIPEEYAPEGQYVVPNERGERLVDYLLSLTYQADVPASAMGPAAADAQDEADSDAHAEPDAEPDTDAEPDAADEGQPSPEATDGAPEGGAP